MKKTVWVLTFTTNQYGQEGDYLHAVWTEKPTREQLLIFFCNGSGNNADHTVSEHKYIGHILNGGGRVGTEDHWYHLTELEVGTEYKHSI